MPIFSIRPLGKTETTAATLTASLSRILPFSCVDGPGSRMVLFFQGCNMNCGSCHNPQTIGLCNHCGDCVSHCQHGALSLIRGVGQRKRLECDASLCQSCDACIEHCSRSGNPSAKRLRVDEVVDKVRDNALLLDGITFSGGEASLQRRFIVALCRKLKQDPECQHLGRLLDSNGLLAVQHWPELMSHCDGVMLDIKAIDDSLHRTLTGRSNHQVLASARWLADNNKLTELRWLVIEGVNDSQAELDGMIALYEELSARMEATLPLRLNAFRHHGVRTEFAATYRATSDERMAQITAKLAEAGVYCYSTTD